MLEAHFYIAYVIRSAEVSYDDLKGKMNLCRSWYRFSESVWVLYTTSDADKLYARLSPLVTPSGSLFISKLDISEQQGWMNEKFWAWMEKNTARNE